MEKTYMCIDLKTFFASVECAERNLDPFTTPLVVADETRGKNGICLAVSSYVRSFGIPNRCRLFEIPKELNCIIAKPRMQLYIQYAADIYAIYLKYISKDDIHVYSVDECFFDVTSYLSLYDLTATQLAKMMMDDVMKTLKITAVAGIGTNLYLAKVALDITAKHTKENISFLNEEIYKETLWHHTPITDFWHVGRGISKRLAKYGIMNMYDLAHTDEHFLYQLFGINAEYLIDHAWGKEPTEIADIKAYHTKEHSISQGQILFQDYTFEEAKLVVKEMVELKCLDLVDQHLVTDSIFLYVGYREKDIKSSKGSMKINYRTNSYTILSKSFMELYEKIVLHGYAIRRIHIGFNHVVDEGYEYYDLFIDMDAIEKEKKVQTTINQIKKKYGKNAVLKGMNLEEKATTISRNKLIGGHNAK